MPVAETADYPSKLEPPLPCFATEEWLLHQGLHFPLPLSPGHVLAGEM